MSNFGDGKWVVGRKQHRCEYCYGPIPKGEEYYQFKGMWAGDWQNWRMHMECWKDHGGEEFMPGAAPMPDRIRSLI